MSNTEMTRYEKRTARRKAFRLYRAHKREHGEDCDFSECAESVIVQMKADNQGSKAIPWTILLPFIESLIEKLCDDDED